jgi:Xaa-Pro dipeptidase
MADIERLNALLAAEARGLALLDAIEASGMIAAGRTELDVERDIRALAEQSFGVKQHWHKRIVRSGINTLRIASDDPPDLRIGDDDTVFLDLGPVFGEWEADVGRTYAIGADPDKRRLCDDLERIFESLRHHFNVHQDVTGTELFAQAGRLAEGAGWLFGGAIAGHIVGAFPHALIPGDKDIYRVSPTNRTRMRDPDARGQTKFWIVEVHLTDLARTFGGFYERLLVQDDLR